MFNEPHWVEVKCKGEHSGVEFFGKFQLKPFLTHAERGDAVRLAEAYCLGIDRTEDQRLFLTTLAFLKFHVVSADKADWWAEGNGLNMVDEEPVFELSRQLNKLQESIRNPEKAQEKQQDESISEKEGKD